MRTHATKPNGEAPPKQETTEHQAPPVSKIVVPDIELKLTPRDLWFVAVGLSMTPWSGGEQRVTTLRAIHKTLRLRDVDRSKVPGTLPSTPVEVVKLPHAQIELMIRVLCGEGAEKAFGGEAGPMMADLVVALRDAVNAAVRKVVEQTVKQPLNKVAKA